MLVFDFPTSLFRYFIAWGWQNHFKVVFVKTVIGVEQRLAKKTSLGYIVSVYGDNYILLDDGKIEDKPHWTWKEA